MAADMTETEKKLKPFLFPVKVQNAYYMDNEASINITPRYKAIIHEDTGQLISIMNSTYELVPNRELIMPVMDQLSQLDTNWYIDESHSFANPNRMRLQVTFPDLTFFDGKSEIAMSMYLHNSYDGSEGVRMFWGAIRFICQNGMVFGKVLSKFYSRHTKNIDISNIREQVEQTYDQIPMISERVQILQNLRVSEQIMKNTGKQLGAGVMNHINSGPHPLNQWALYNLITYYISHQVEMRMRASYQMKLSRLFEL